MELRLEQVNHRYADVDVLQSIDLDIVGGRVTCLIGPSGCGKSTLLRIIGGMERPASGRVMQEGAVPPDTLNPLTYVFQDFALLPWRTVEGNIRLVLEDHRLSRAARREIVDDVLERTRLTDFRDALPRQLSGGMRQRVGIARALAVRPAVLLMDEPLSALDSQTRELLMDDLVGLWTRSPFTAVYVTHNLDEAVRLGHRIVLLSRRPGTIRQIVTIDRPLAGRDDRDGELAAIRARLWQEMRDEVVRADNELVHG
ncbi:MAG: ABC transporter ATP-binding protein [Geminicoccaceae bacterium]|nr:ABC transporter ATP-binding protein [Geminicoccaceae bacterium]MCB9944802.1 ABC transporter ATP-binding protein [Geminicoccaceae bacterium]